LVYRLLASEAEVDSMRLRLNLITEREQSRIVNAVGDLSEVPMYIDDTAGLPISEIRGRARRLQIERGLDLLIVDYIQLVHGSRRYDNRVMEMSEISGTLKELSQELNIPVLAISQLSRAVEQRPTHRPQLADLRDSGTMTCLEPVTGKVLWQERIIGPSFSSPVCVDGRIYCVSRKGEVVVVKAAEKFELLARNKLPEGSHATPAVADGRMYLRTYHRLICIGAAK